MPDTVTGLEQNPEDPDRLVLPGAAALPAAWAELLELEGAGKLYAGPCRANPGGCFGGLLDPPPHSLF